jgi:acyl-CoA thioester hydrolase
VNNVQYLQWMQDAAVQHSHHAGCTARTKALGATWVIRMHRIEYLRPAFARNRITVLTWVSNFRRVRSLRKYLFLVDDEDAPLARGETDWVFVKAVSGRPAAIPVEVRTVFTLVPEEDESEELRSRLGEAQRELTRGPLPEA